MENTYLWRFNHSTFLHSLHQVNHLSYSLLSTNFFNSQLSLWCTHVFHKDEPLKRISHVSFTKAKIFKEEISSFLSKRPNIQVKAYLEFKCQVNKKNENFCLIFKMIYLKKKVITRLCRGSYLKCSKRKKKALDANNDHI